MLKLLVLNANLTKTWIHSKKTANFPTYKLQHYTSLTSPEFPAFTNVYYYTQHDKKNDDNNANYIFEVDETRLDRSTRLPVPSLFPSLTLLSLSSLSLSLYLWCLPFE